MVDVFEQVEDEIRSERYKRMARLWLPIVGGILLLALLAALAWWGWQSYQTSRAETASVAYQRGLEALQAGDTATADTAFIEAADAGSGAYESLALQQRAGIAVTANRLPEAIALFDQAAEADGDPVLADAARLKAALLVMDSGTLADIEARLTPLTEEGRPQRPFAQEALAMARLQNGQNAEARSLFVQLSLGQDVPEPVRQRAQLGINMIDTGSVAAIDDIVRAQAALPTTAPAQAPTTAAPAAAPAPAPGAAQ